MRCVSLLQGSSLVVRRNGVGRASGKASAPECCGESHRVTTSRSRVISRRRLASSERPSNNEPGPTSTKIGPLWAESGQNGPRVGRHSPEGQLRANSTEVCPTSTELGQIVRGVFGRCCKHCAIPGRTLPRFVPGQIWPTSVELGQLQSNSPPTHGRHRPHLVETDANPVD